MTDLAYNLGDVFQWTFKILEMLGNLPNYLFIVIGFVGFGFWMMKQSQYTARDKREGNIV